MDKLDFPHEKIQELNMINWNKETFDFYKSIFDIAAEIGEKKLKKEIPKITWEDFQEMQKEWKQKNEN